MAVPVPSPNAEPTPAGIATPDARPEPAAPSATATTTLTPEPTPAATTTATQVPESAWTPLAAGTNVHAFWSPDARHLLVFAGGPNDPPEKQTMWTMTRTGEIVQQFQRIEDGRWIDNETYLLYAYQRRPDGTMVHDESGEPLTSAFIGALGSDAIEPVEVGDRAVSNGHGVLAVPGCKECDPDKTWHEQQSYSFWMADGAPAGQHHGIPIAWSPDGDRLLVVHPVDDNSPNWASWPEILEWPSLDRLYGDPDNIVPVTVDPALEHVAYWDIDLDGYRVIDIDSGDETSVSPAPGNAALDGRGRFIAADYQTYTGYAYDLSGATLATWSDVGDWITVSADGSTIAFFYNDQVLQAPNLVSVIAGDELTSLTTPGQLWTPGLALAPDGSAILAICIIDGRYVAFVLSL